MIDPRLLREHPDLVRASQRARGEDEGLVDTALTADESRRAAIARFEALRAEQKTLGRAVAAARGDERAPLLERSRELAAAVKAAEAAQGVAVAAFDAAVLALSNVVADGVPPGGEEHFVVLEQVGEPPAFDFAPLDHVELGRRLGGLDLERGAKVSGARFYFLTGVGARLATALVRYAQDVALAAGFVPVLPPALVRPEAMEGTGFLGQAAENVYRVQGDDLYLVGTSEVPLAALHMDEILDLAEPLRYSGFSPCFRREAGSHGKDTRGIIRVHQFDKVEMFVFCAPEQAEDEHRRLLEQEKAFLVSLGLAFRVIDVAAGDLGASAARKYDCEAWIPTQGRYREVTSTSNCTQFQARRLRVRSRDADGGTRPAATLNGTLCAVPRVLVAILENFQRADGSVVVPEVLQPYLGVEVLAPVVP